MTPHTLKPRLGGPTNLQLQLAPSELANLAVLRDGAEAVIGFAVSEEEVQGAITDISLSKDHLLWLFTETSSHFINTNSLPADAVAHLQAASAAQLSLNIFSLPVDDSPTEQAKHTS